MNSATPRRSRLEHRIYPDEATQQALMDSVLAVATGMRYVQNLLAATHPGPPTEPGGPDDVED